MDTGTGIAFASLVIPATLALSRLWPDKRIGDKYDHALCENKHKVLEQRMEQIVADLRRDMEYRQATTSEKLTEIKLSINQMQEKIEQLIKCTAKRSTDK